MPIFARLPSVERFPACVAFVRFWCYFGRVFVCLCTVAAACISFKCLNAQNRAKLLSVCYLSIEYIKSILEPFLSLFWAYIEHTPHPAKITHHPHQHHPARKMPQKMPKNRPFSSEKRRYFERARVKVAKVESRKSRKSAKSKVF